VQRLEVPISEADVPAVAVTVHLVGSEAARPASASVSEVLSVPPATRALQVKVAPRNAIARPGARDTVDVEVKDAFGRPVRGAEVVVMAVDESVLALTGYRVPNPLNGFYSTPAFQPTGAHLRTFVEGAGNWESSWWNSSGWFSGTRRMGNDGLAVGIPMLRNRDGSPIAVRESNWKLLEDIGSTSDVRPIVSTYDSGRMPVFWGNYGNLDQNHPPLQHVRFSPGSFNIYNGSTRSLGRSSPAHDVGMAFGGTPPPLALRTNLNPLALFAPSARTDGNGRATVALKLPDSVTRYRITAVAAAGAKRFGVGESILTARLPLMVRVSAPRFLNYGDRFSLPVIVENPSDEPQTVEVAARAFNAALTGPNGFSVTVPANDRVKVSFPVATKQAGPARFQVAASAARANDAAEVTLPVKAPAVTESFATYGELDAGALVQPIKIPGDILTDVGGLTVSTSSTQTQSLTDAWEYLAEYPFETPETLASRILASAALHEVLPTSERGKRLMARDGARLLALRNADGGFPLWESGASWPFTSVHAAHALVRLPAATQTRKRAVSYLRNIERVTRDYDVDTRRDILAYALHVRALLGDADLARTRQLISEAALDRLSTEALAYALDLLHAVPASEAIVQELHNRVRETAGTAEFKSSGDSDTYLCLASDTRTNAVVLQALLRARPQSELIPKLVRGLLADRTRGRWESTQENAFVLLALAEYFRKFERVKPDFTARVWLGEVFAGAARFRGRKTDEKRVDIPMAALRAPRVILDKNGPGRLYYRLALRYVPSELLLRAADHGFVMKRTFAAVDDPADVRREADGSWHVRAGARIRMAFSVETPATRYHVALVNPLPAGFEAAPKSSYALASWGDHENVRDDRLEVFISRLWSDTYDHAVLCRATTPGTFIVPPTTAEELYAPETFGRTASDVVVVE